MNDGLTERQKLLYKVIGQPDTYSQYNEAWRDCMDRVINIVKRGGVENDS